MRATSILGVALALLTSQVHANDSLPDSVCDFELSRMYRLDPETSSKSKQYYTQCDPSDRCEMCRCRYMKKRKVGDKIHVWGVCTADEDIETCEESINNILDTTKSVGERSDFTFCDEDEPGISSSSSSKSDSSSGSDELPSDDPQASYDAPGSSTSNSTSADASSSSTLDKNSSDKGEMDNSKYGNGPNAGDDSVDDDDDRSRDSSSAQSSHSSANKDNHSSSSSPKQSFDSDDDDSASYSGRYHPGNVVGGAGVGSDSADFNGDGKKGLTFDSSTPSASETDAETGSDQSESGIYASEHDGTNDYRPATPSQDKDAKHSKPPTPSQDESKQDPPPSTSSQDEDEGSIASENTDNPNTLSDRSNQKSSRPLESNTGAIVGIAIACAVGVAAIVGLFVMRRRHNKLQKQASDGPIWPPQDGSMGMYAPTDRGTRESADLPSNYAGSFLETFRPPMALTTMSVHGQGDTSRKGNSRSGPSPNHKGSKDAYNDRSNKNDLYESDDKFSVGMSVYDDSNHQSLDFLSSNASGASSTWDEFSSRTGGFASAMQSKVNKGGNNRTRDKNNFSRVEEESDPDSSSGFENDEEFYRNGSSSLNLNSSLPAYSKNKKTTGGMTNNWGSSSSALSAHEEEMSDKEDRKSMEF